MEPFVLAEKEYFLIKEWMDAHPELAAGFTTKNGGASKPPFAGLNMGFHVEDDPNTVCQNRTILSNLLDFSLGQWVGAEQTHEVHIEKVTNQDRGKGAIHYEDSFKGTDGFYTFEKGILLTLCFADCVPLFFAAPKQGIAGIAHAGWKGSVNGIAGEMVSAFAAEGINPEEILAAIGPSICENCYIVDDRVISRLQNKLDDVGKKPYNLIKENQYSLNLKELNKQILMGEGVLEKNITITNFCTSCHQEHFFSHRKDKGKTGRMLAFIGLKEVLHPT